MKVYHVIFKVYNKSQSEFGNQKQSRSRPESNNPKIFRLVIVTNNARVYEHRKVYVQFA